MSETSGRFYLVIITSVVMLLVPLLFPLPALAEGVAEFWHKVYDSGRDDVANGVAIDSHDNVIVAGYITNGSGNTDFYTIKYNKNGNELWSKTYDSGLNDAAYDVAVDSLDNIIATGYTTNAGGSSEFYTIKYDKNGNELWNKTYDSPLTDWAWGVAVDSRDNVIVTGQRRDGAGCNYYTIKYNSDGNEVWSREYLSGAMCEVFDVAVDSQDNVIVTGQCGFPYGYYHTVKYDKDGNQLWVATSGIPLGDSEGKAVTTDSKDNVIVTGESGPQVDWNYIFRYCTIKYNGNGNELWKKTYFGGIDDCAWGVAVDSQDNIVVTGSTTNASRIADYYTIKYNRNGNELWNKTFGIGHDDSANDVAIDSQDNVIVTGSIKNADGNNDYATIKYAQQTVTVNTATNTGTATFSTNSGGIVDIMAILSDNSGCQWVPVSFPHGLFSFNIVGITPGSTVTLTITLPSDIPRGTQYWKCQNGAWVNCTSLLGSNDGDNVLTLTLTDGGLGDADEVANGTFVDPGGPGYASAPSQSVEGTSSGEASSTTISSPNLNITYLSVNPSQTMANKPVTISANVVNRGGMTGSTRVALKINGKVEETKLVTVGPGGSRPVKFTVTKAEPGAYTIIMGSQRASFLVTENTDDNFNMNGGLVAILILGLLIIATVMVVALSFR